MYESPEYISRKEELTHLRRSLNKQEKFFSTGPFKALQEPNRIHLRSIYEDQKKHYEQRLREWDAFLNDYKANPPPDPQQSFF